MPIVSIIVPVYNVEAYLQRCVDSILAQTFTDFELILVDDGSTDSSPAICDTYAARDARVIVIHKKNGGVSSARNEALDIIQGEYVAFCDSDDYWEANLIECTLGAMYAAQADCVHFGYYTHRSSGVTSPIRACIPTVRAPDNQSYPDRSPNYSNRFQTSWKM